MASSYAKPRSKKKVAFGRFLSVFLLTLLGALYVILYLRSSSVSDLVIRDEIESFRTTVKHYTTRRQELNLPKQNKLSIMLEKRNQLPPRNMGLHPSLAEDHIVIVLYVHNRPRYLKLVVDSLSKVEGINETLLIVSHDGYFEEINSIIESIKFCQVKQIFAPYSPHIFENSFPGASPEDCKEKSEPEPEPDNDCVGTTDQYGNHRSPKIVSLKHHWWWMMNTVWDGLKETQHHSGHILFIEEDHFIYPNAYRNLQLLAELKPSKCPDCYAANLAPSDVKSRGEGWESLVAEKIGNVGYAFNRTVWNKIHEKATEFCTFDDYNWDVTMSAAVYPAFGSRVYSLRGPRTSAVHFGRCGLHHGLGEKTVCVTDYGVKLEENADEGPNIRREWSVYVYTRVGYRGGFKGWGGWGDRRDHQMCLDFGKMYYYGLERKRSTFLFVQFLREIFCVLFVKQCTSLD